MSPSLWKDIKKTFKEGVTIAAEKTEEYTKIGKIKVEMVNLKKNVDKTFKELGEEVYASIKKGQKSALGQSKKVKDLAAKIDNLKRSLKSKEAEIEIIKKEASLKKEKVSKPPAASKPKRTGTKRTTTKSTKK